MAAARMLSGAVAGSSPAPAAPPYPRRSDRNGWRSSNAALVGHCCALARALDEQGSRRQLPGPGCLPVSATETRSQSGMRFTDLSSGPAHHMREVACSNPAGSTSEAANGAFSVRNRSQHGSPRCERLHMDGWTSRALANATPEQVLEVLTHPGQIRRWSPVEFDAEGLDCRPLAAGTRTKVSGRV